MLPFISGETDAATINEKVYSPSSASRAGSCITVAASQSTPDQRRFGIYQPYRTSRFCVILQTIADKIFVSLCLNPSHGSRGLSIEDPSVNDPSVDNPSTMVMIKELDTRPISLHQLVSEVECIYAGLIILEEKCIELEDTQSSDTKFSSEQWQELIKLHCTLLHEYHDFFLASQHPSASPQLRELATKYNIPARMWRHGIHSLLKRLRHKLPETLEYMLNFIYLSYTITALLYETVPTFENTWIECLGDLGRYRLAIEDGDILDREVWTGLSKSWYRKASKKSPLTVRFYYHRAKITLMYQHWLSGLFLWRRTVRARRIANNIEDLLNRNLLGTKDRDGNGLKMTDENGSDTGEDSWVIDSCIGSTTGLCSEKFA
jgi:hypothetical protein